MLKTSKASPTTPLGREDADCPALRNNAVARCAGVWAEACRASTIKAKSAYKAEVEAGKALRHAMPSKSHLAPQPSPNPDLAPPPATFSATS